MRINNIINNLSVIGYYDYERIIKILQLIEDENIYIGRSLSN